MSNCLLCGEILEIHPKFYQILTLQEEVVSLCPTCQAGFEKIGDSHCPCCCKPNDGEICSDCLYWQEQGVVVNHEAIYSYNTAMKSYFSLYKFFGDYLLAQLFAKDIKKALKKHKGYAVVPVPVSPKTFAERGFNQVEGLLAAAGVPVVQVLIKGEGKKQSSKTRAERLKSTPQYGILDKNALPKKIILVDDIYTTGATIASIARLLRENGVESVKTFSLSR
jgi:competence protein ComFC